MCFADKVAATKLTVAPRIGVMNVGADTDKGKTYVKVLHPVSWPWQTVSKALMDGCQNEPFSGHYSGSIVEVLFMLDLLNEKGADIPTWIDLAKADTKLKTDPRKANAALASAFLIGIGYHSAVEILPTIRQYLGDPSIRGFAEGVKYKDICKDKTINPTNELSDLMKISGRRRRRSSN